MFRASSEIAVATTARSVEGKPHWDANPRPFWRAETMSASESIATRTSSAMSANLISGTLPLPLSIKVGKTLFEIQRRRDPLEREPQLDHREGDLRLDPDDDGLRSTQPDHVRDVTQGPGRERVDNVERRDVHDDAAGPDHTDPLDQGVAQLLQVLVRERGLDRRDQIRALLENRNLHGSSLPRLRGLRGRLPRQDDLVPQQPLGLFDAALEVADRVHLPQVHSDVNKGLGDLGRQTGDDNGRAEQPRGLDGLDQMVGHGRVDVGHARDVQHDDLGAVGPDAAEQLLGQLPRALGIDDADDGDDEQALANLEDRGRQLTDRFLLLAADALALLDETAGDRDRDAVGRRLVRVEHAIELVEVFVILREERAREHVAKQEHDPDDLVRLDASRNDAFREVARVGF